MEDGCMNNLAVCALCKLQRSCISAAVVGYNLEAYRTRGAEHPLARSRWLYVHRPPICLCYVALKSRFLPPSLLGPRLPLIIRPLFTCWTGARGNSCTMFLYTPPHCKRRCCARNQTGVLVVLYLRIPVVMGSRQPRYAVLTSRINITPSRTSKSEEYYGRDSPELL